MQALHNGTEPYPPVLGTPGDYYLARLLQVLREVLVEKGVGRLRGPVRPGHDHGNTQLIRIERIAGHALKIKGQLEALPQWDRVGHRLGPGQAHAGGLESTCAVGQLELGLPFPLLEDLDLERSQPRYVPVCPGAIMAGRLPVTLRIAQRDVEAELAFRERLEDVVVRKTVMVVAFRDDLHGAFVDRGRRGKAQSQPGGVPDCIAPGRELKREGESVLAHRGRWSFTLEREPGQMPSCLHVRLPDRDGPGRPVPEIRQGYHCEDNGEEDKKAVRTQYSHLLRRT